jgi:hypothetical protein
MNEDNYYYSEEDVILLAEKIKNLSNHFKIGILSFFDDELFLTLKNEKPRVKSKREDLNIKEYLKILESREKLGIPDPGYLSINFLFSDDVSAPTLSFEVEFFRDSVGYFPYLFIQDLPIYFDQNSKIRRVKKIYPLRDILDLDNSIIKVPDELIHLILHYPDLLE